ncbi:MAG: DUF63 family protein [Methanobacteriota archaeon]
MVITSRDWLRMHRFSVIFGFLLGIFCVILIGCLVAPSLFYDEWIWKYYWGPVVADATGHPVSWHGVQANEGYTLFSEITYGILLIGALYGLYHLLKKLKIVVDWYFCLALLPYILFGPVTRVLEDTTYFSESVVYWFISPLIYLQTTVYVLVFLLLGYFLETRGQQWLLKRSVIFAFLFFIFIDLCYTGIWILGISYGALRIDPGVFSLLSLVAFLPIFYRFIRKQVVSTNSVVFSGGLLVLLPCLFLIGKWFIGDRWGVSYGVRVDVLLLIGGLVTLILLGVYLIARVFQKHKAFGVYGSPLNLAMIGGHMIDGLTSYVSIYDPLHMGLPSYLEKHPASNTLMMIWPPLFPIVKFLLIILVIYLFDVLYKKDLQQHLRLVNLLKIGIFILGVSPGLRDLLRVTMGV